MHEDGGRIHQDKGEFGHLPTSEPDFPTLTAISLRRAEARAAGGGAPRASPAAEGAPDAAATTDFLVADAGRP